MIKFPRNELNFKYRMSFQFIPNYTIGFSNVQFGITAIQLLSTTQKFISVQDE
jgi:hypothetical protein